jgi:hypothetical protein
MFRTNTDLQSFFKKSADLVDAQAGCDGLAGNKSIQPHGVDGVFPVFLASWGSFFEKGNELGEKKAAVFFFECG